MSSARYGCTTALTRLVVITSLTTGLKGSSVRGACTDGMGYLNLDNSLLDCSRARYRDESLERGRIRDTVVCARMDFKIVVWNEE